MATMTTKYLLELDQTECLILKKILGGLNDYEFAGLGVDGDDRQRVSDIWILLPSSEDEYTDFIRD